MTKFQKNYYDFHWYMSKEETVVSKRLAEFMFSKEPCKLGIAKFCFRDTQWTSKINWDNFITPEYHEEITI